jgi:YtkA-like
MVEEEITPQPVVVGPAEVTVRLADAQGNPLTNARLTVEGNMSHPGMSPVFADAKETSNGRYQANMDIAMAGDWVLLLHIKLPGGKLVERQVDVKSVRVK